MAGEEVVEGAEVGGFLSVHMLQEGSEVRVGACQRGGLGGVDEGGGEFAGLVDAELFRVRMLAR